VKPKYLCTLVILLLPPLARSQTGESPQGDGIKMEIEHPYDTDGNGLIDDPDNEFSFDTSDPAVLQIICQAFNSPGADPDNLHWTIESIGTVEGVWSPHIGSDEHIGKGLNPMVTFTGMPEHNSDFGRKKITLSYEGLSCSDEEYIEVFLSH